MTVQMIAVPPTQAAMIMSTVSVVRVILAEDEGVDEAVDDASDAEVVIVTFAMDAGVVAGEEEVITAGV